MLVCDRRRRARAHANLSQRDDLLICAAAVVGAEAPLACGALGRAGIALVCPRVAPKINNIRIEYA